LKYSNIDNLFKSFLNDENISFIDIEGIGEKINEIVVDNLKKISYYYDLFKNVYKVKFIERERKENNNINIGVLSNKTFILSGSFSKKKSEIEKDIINNGGVINNSVNKELDFLITNETGTSKYNKAVQLNKTILTEDELLMMIK